MQSNSSTLKKRDYSGALIGSLQAHVEALAQRSASIRSNSFADKRNHDALRDLANHLSTVQAEDPRSWLLWQISAYTAGDAGAYVPGEMQECLLASLGVGAPAPSPETTFNELCAAATADVIQLLAGQRSEALGREQEAERREKENRPEVEKLDRLKAEIAESQAQIEALKAELNEERDKVEFLKARQTAQDNGSEPEKAQDQAAPAQSRRGPGGRLQPAWRREPIRNLLAQPRRGPDV
jgi:hypothetical protein